MITTQIGVLQSVQVGTPQRYGISKATDPLERRWQTSFFRTPSTEPRWLYTTHLDGNMQADLKHHGRPDQAVLLYAASNYPLWWAELGRQDIGPGGFGENFTMDGLSEETACIGDIYALDEAQIRVTGPRYPCWKIERRWGSEGLTARVAATGRTGWYCCVLHEGMIKPGMPVSLIERPYPEWTVALVNDFAHGRNKDVEKAEMLSSCPLLHGFWRELVVRGAKRQK
jgi:MOSC domain-containing protein YiiM